VRTQIADDFEVALTCHDPCLVNFDQSSRRHKVILKMEGSCPRENLSV
jgi:hypothetical protein